MKPRGSAPHTGGKDMKEVWEIWDDMRNDYAILMRERDEEMDAYLQEYAPDMEAD